MLIFQRFGTSARVVRCANSVRFTVRASDMRTRSLLAALSVAGILTLSTPAGAVILDISIAGSDAIFLAGRTDLVIPPAAAPWTGPGDFLIRHGGPTPEEIRETVPPFISVAPGDIIRAANPAVGGVSFFNGLGPPLYGPGGNGVSGSNLTPLGGISGYFGPQGPLTGVFLDNNVPIADPPATLDFSPGGLGIDFPSLSPALGQVFYIGDGVTAGNVFQTFIAPAGATRLFLGIPDGFGFVGAPGAYDDNDGAYRIRIGVNEVPTIPEPGTLALAGLALFGLAFANRRRAGIARR